MPASRNSQSSAATQSRRLDAFLEMLTAERGAARLTIAAYRNDLANLAGFLTVRGQSLETAEATILHEYQAAAASRRLAPRTLARRLSAMRQFYRFLLSEGARAETSTNGVQPQRASLSLTLRVGMKNRNGPHHRLIVGSSKSRSLLRMRVVAATSAVTGLVMSRAR